MKELIAICDTQSIYARRLSEYISKKSDSNYDVRIYSSLDIVRESLADKKISVLVVDEQLLDSDGMIFDGVRRIVRLCHDPYGEGVYKYQSAAVIYKEITEETIFSENNYVEKSPIKNNLIKHGSPVIYKLQVKQRVQDKLLIRGLLTDDETLKVIDETIDELFGEYVTSSEFDLLSRSTDIDTCIDTGIDEVIKNLNRDDRINLRNQVFYSIRGLDVLEELIADDSITEIMVNGEENIFYEKNGRLINSGKKFDSRETLLDIIRKIVADANRTVNMSNPIVDARLKDGSRINAVLEPVSLEGPILTIRRFPREPLSAEKLISMGAVSEEIMNLLRKLVYAGYNILVSGSTGSGKTTFLNILSSFIPKDERIITIEDSAELKIMGIENLVRLESRNANVDGCQEITIRDLIRSALRMRPDRIIVGECRGAEAVDMLQSFLVGQDGSMSTIHANSAEDALYRLEMLMMINSVDIPLNALRRQIATGVDIIIQLGRLKDKRRKLMEIREVTGYEDGEIITGLLYRYEGGEFIKHDEIRNTYKLEKAGFVI